MTDDEAAMKQDPEPPLAVKAAILCILLLVVAPALMWGLLFGVVWVIYSLPWSAPHPMFLAECLATGSQWACERV
jgi:hypothetical protein